MAETTDQVCFCAQPGSADASGTGHFAVGRIDQLCLEARLRRDVNGRKQVLVLTMPRNDENRGSEALCPSVSLFDQGLDVVQLALCGNSCLSASPLVTALTHGFERVFLQLSDELTEMAEQLKLVEQVTQRVGSQTPVMSLFYRSKTLDILLGELAGQDGGDTPVGPGDPNATAALSPKAHLSLQGDCTLCGHCVLLCPLDALQIVSEAEMLSVSDARCTGCGICVAACPVQALVLNSQEPLKQPVSKFAREDLIVEQDPLSASDDDISEKRKRLKRRSEPEVR